MNRRRFVQVAAATVVGVPAATGLYTWLIEPHWLQVTRPELPIAGLPPALDGATLAQLSDLHIGPRVSDDYIAATFARVTRLAPDFVVYTGDWITYRSAAQYEQLRRHLTQAPRGRLGTVGVLGNHDYGFQWRMTEVADRVATLAREAGVTILRNEAASVAGLQFLGLDDLWSPAFAPAPLLAAHGGDLATLVLCHNPDAADRPVWADYRGWILAGHTHGGQCKPPFLPPPLLPVANRRYTAGAIPLDDGRRLYISRGVGHLLQVRFNVRPEVPLFTLRSVTASSS